MKNFHGEEQAGWCSGAAATSVIQSSAIGAAVPPQQVAVWRKLRAWFDEAQHAAAQIQLHDFLSGRRALPAFEALQRLAKPAFAHHFTVSKSIVDGCIHKIIAINGVEDEVCQWGRSYCFVPCTLTGPQWVCGNDTFSGVRDGEIDEMRALIKQRQNDSYSVNFEWDDGYLERLLAELIVLENQRAFRPTAGMVDDCVDGLGAQWQALRWCYIR